MSCQPLVSLAVYIRMYNRRMTNIAVYFSARHQYRGITWSALHLSPKPSSTFLQDRGLRQERKELGERTIGCQGCQLWSWKLKDFMTTTCIPVIGRRSTPSRLKESSNRKENVCCVHRIAMRCSREVRCISVGQSNGHK